MKSGLSAKNRWFSLLLILAANQACKQPASDVAKADDFQHQRVEKYTREVWPVANETIANGDLVLRLGSDITSMSLRKLNLNDDSFSHCGIASIENDTVFVYHALGGEFNPNQKLLRESLFSFGHPADNRGIGIFKPALKPGQLETLNNHIRKAFALGLPFDMQFDYETNEQQYCAEFVAKAYCSALSDSSWLKFTRKGNFSYVAVDNLFLSPIMTEKQRLIY